jgi:hypothetical protein
LDAALVRGRFVENLMRNIFIASMVAGITATAPFAASLGVGPGSPETASPVGYVNVQYDVPYLMATGATQYYDTSIGVNDATIQNDYAGLTPTNTGPMGTANVHVYMPDAGGRDDLAPQPQWTVRWLMSQNANAWYVMMANANASGNIPWHFTDESTNAPVVALNYQGPNPAPGYFWESSNSAEDGTQYLQPPNGWPSYNTGSATSFPDPWTPDVAHIPELNYLPYLTTASHYQLKLLEHEADFVVANNDLRWVNDQSNTVPFGIATGEQTRGQAWALRTVSDATYIVPDTDPYKQYMSSELGIAMTAYVQEYITDGPESSTSPPVWSSTPPVTGSNFSFMQGFYTIGYSPPGAGGNGQYGQSAIEPWEEDYLVSSMGGLAGMNISPASAAAARQMLNWNTNFTTGRFSGANGFNPYWGAAYVLATFDCSTDAAVTSWAALFTTNQEPACANVGVTEPFGGAVTSFPVGGPNPQGYPSSAFAALVEEAEFDTAPNQALANQALGFVTPTLTTSFGSAANELAQYQVSPGWKIMVRPSLPMGLWSDPGPAAAPASGVDIAPAVAQPSQTGDIVGVQLQNTTSAPESGFVTFGQVFLPGTVKPTDSLVARIGGVNYYVQMDVKATNSDGSVRHAALTLDSPTIIAGGTLGLLLAKGTTALQSPAAPTAAALLTSGYNTKVYLLFHNANGSLTPASTNASAVLASAIGNSTVETWLSGPLVNEYDVVGTVNGGLLKVEFDIRAYADGSTTTDVIFDNSWVFSSGKRNLDYNVSIDGVGGQIYSMANIQQYLYSLWDHVVSGGALVTTQ